MESDDKTIPANDQPEKKETLSAEEKAKRNRDRARAGMRALRARRKAEAA